MTLSVKPTTGVSDYVWKRNDVIVVGQNESQLPLFPMSPGAAGTYL